MKDYLIIGIAGPSAGGKTTVTEKIKETFGDDVVIIKYDNYYNDQTHLSFEERIKVNYDHPNAFDTELLLEHLQLLISGQTVKIPTYDFSSYNRSDIVNEVKPKKIIIIEGLFTLLEESIRNLLDIKIYVETDLDICFIRRLKRDIDERGRTLDSVISQYTEAVKPMHEKFINPTRKYADIVVLNGGKNPVVNNMINSMITNHEVFVKQ